VAGGNGRGSAANQLFDPFGLLVDQSGNIYVTDRDNHRIQKWAPGASSGVTVAGGNRSGSAANQLNSPIGSIFIDALGNIYVNDQGNHRIQKWAPGAIAGVTVAGGNGRGSDANQLYNPFDFCVDKAENLYISDMNNFRIQKWAPGASFGTTIVQGYGDNAKSNQLKYPSSIFIDANGYLYVVDGDRIQRLGPFK
jgi:sugar lactone lactonase YvrE